MPLPIIKKVEGAQKGNDRRNGILSLGSQINDQIGAPLDAANMLMDNKHIGKIGDGLSLISIIDEVGNGEYWSAAGDILLFAAGKTKLSPYLTAISLGTWMYHTDLMQRRLARLSAREYLRLLYELERETDWNTKQKLRSQIETQRKIFEECLRNLGIKN